MVFVRWYWTKQMNGIKVTAMNERRKIFLHGEENQKKEKDEWIKEIKGQKMNAEWKRGKIKFCDVKQHSLSLS